MPPSGKTFKKKLTVVSQTVIATWNNTKGGAAKETHLYKVEAVDEHGAPIDQELRSFAELEIGILMEYEVEPYESEKHGKSFTLKKPRANTTARVAELEQQMQGALERITTLEEQVSRGPGS